MANTFHCTLVTPETQVFEIEATYVSVPANDGLVGIQAGRAPLLAKLGYGALRVETADGKERTMLVGDGFVQMNDDKLTILANEAKETDSFTADEAKAALAEALKVTAVSEQEVAKKDKAVDRARAMVAISA